MPHMGLTGARVAPLYAAQLLPFTFLRQHVAVECVWQNCVHSVGSLVPVLPNAVPPEHC